MEMVIIKVMTPVRALVRKRVIAMAIRLARRMAIV
jgi:hypothetical protein